MLRFVVDSHGPKRFAGPVILFDTFSIARDIRDLRLVKVYVWCPRWSWAWKAEKVKERNSSAKIEFTCKRPPSYLLRSEIDWKTKYIEKLSERNDNGICCNDRFELVETSCGRKVDGSR